MPFSKNTLYGYAFLAALFMRTASMPQAPRGVSLVLSLEVPSTVTNVGEFVISGTLKNSGSQSISVIKDPEGPLFDNFPADIFDFQSTKNGEPGFVGAIAKWSLETYLTHPGEEDKTVPKVEGRSPAQDDQRRDESISGRGSTSSSVESDSDTESLTFSKSKVPPETIHDLTPNDEMKFDYKVAEGYDFSHSGAGEYSVKLLRNYFWALVDGVVTQVDIDLKSYTVNIGGDLATRSIEDIGAAPVNRNKRGVSITTRGCSPLEDLVLNEAAAIANEYVTESRTYLSKMSASTPRYKQWLGDWNAGKTSDYDYIPKEQVASLYSRIRSFTDPAGSSGYTYECSCERPIYAYVLSKVTNDPVIHLCVWFRAAETPLKGENSKAGTLVHEATHLLVSDKDRRAVDYKYGHEQCIALAKQNPHLAAVNADNVEFFSENTPPLD